MCTPRPRCWPLHSKQWRVPWLTLAHWGPFVAQSAHVRFPASLRSSATVGCGICDIVELRHGSTIAPSPVELSHESTIPLAASWSTPRVKVCSTVDCRVCSSCLNLCSVGSLGCVLTFLQYILFFSVSTRSVLPSESCRLESTRVDSAESTSIDVCRLRARELASKNTEKLVTSGLALPIIETRSFLLSGATRSLSHRCFAAGGSKHGVDCRRGARMDPVLELGAEKAGVPRPRTLEEREGVNRWLARHEARHEARRSRVESDALPPPPPCRSPRRGARAAWG